MSASLLRYIERRCQEEALLLNRLRESGTVCILNSDSCQVEAELGTPVVTVAENAGKSGHATLLKRPWPAQQVSQPANSPSSELYNMTHILAHNSDLSLAPSSLQSALMDPNQQHMHHHQQHQQQPPSPQPARKRKKPDGAPDDSASPAEPRRLRRSHEACARCRSKKIKASPVGHARRQLPYL
jgi:hypothetical protein